MAQRRISTLAHRDRENPKSRSHRQILMMIRLFPPARRLMMNALRRWNIKHLPLPAQTITKIQILAGRASREEGCKATDRVECLSPQRTRATSDPLTRYRVFGCRWKSVWECCSDQFAGLKSFNRTVQQ